MYLTQSGLSRPGVFLLVTNLFVTILKARSHGSFSISRIKSSSGHMLRSLSASPPAWCPPTTQQTLPNQAHLWVWFPWYVFEACLCWDVLCSRRGSFLYRPFLHSLGDSALLCWTQCTGGQYALPDQGPEGAGSWSHMAHHLGRARLTSASPRRGPGKTPFSDEALPVDCHTETIFWTVIGHRRRRLCSVPQKISYTSSVEASFKREPIYRIFSHIHRTHITVMRRCHTFNSLISRRHTQTHF